MMIYGSPVDFKPSEETGYNAAEHERFWYWSGLSGRRYIHSVYDPEDCPLLPGSGYIVVKRVGSLRSVLAVERFSSDCFCAPQWLRKGGEQGIEIHVHLLAHGEEHARKIYADLRAGFDAGLEDIQTKYRYNFYCDGA